ncbi:MAG TPA: OmpH family outer membrane protein [Bacteroidales bacterium]|nr:OmpH family outer membrane protein [Bacteroidales bacterium]
MWAKNRHILQFLFLTGLLGAWIVYEHQTTPKTGFVIIQEVYNGFEMKKEIEQKYINVKTARDRILDSLNLDLKTIAKKIEDEQQKNQNTIATFNIKREDFLQRKQTYEEDNAALTKQYDQEILIQINQYIKDFGEENHYTYVFGNDGNGSLMYAVSTKDITKEVIEFINARYNGKN